MIKEKFMIPLKKCLTIIIKLILNSITKGHPIVDNFFLERNYNRYFYGLQRLNNLIGKLCILVKWCAGWVNHSPGASFPQP